MLVYLLLLLVPCVFGYSESLKLRPLPHSKLLASWTFELASQSSPLHYNNGSDFLAATSHYTEFPRALGPIVHLTNTRELHLRFGQGYWDYDVWGGLPDNGAHAGGPGVELWATIEAENVAEARLQWAKLANSLLGFFCASFNHIDALGTSFPRRSVDWSDAAASSSEINDLANPNNKLYLLRAALPAEPVCTENLTPFLKLLPTRGKLGVASLLEGHRVFDLLWHAMLIDIATECTLGTENCQLTMRQLVNAVVDVIGTLRKAKEGGIPRPIEGNQLRCDPEKPHNIWQCFPLPDAQDVLWSLEDILGRRVKGAAFEGVPLKVIIDAPFYNVSAVEHNENGWAITKLDGQGGILEYNIDTMGDLDFKFETTDASPTKRNQAAPIQVSRSLTGYSLDSGGLRVSFFNPTEELVTFSYYEVLPWFMRLYLHTLSVEGAKADGSVLEDPELYIKSRYFKPAIDRKRPSHMELLFELPAGFQLTLNYQFDKSLLLYAEYPPDANHGFPIAPAVVAVLQNERKVYELRTNSLLVTLPTPDFLMPYNVIILTSTVMSLVFGLVYNLLIRKIITEEELDSLAAKLKLALLKARIQALFRRK